MENLRQAAPLLLSGPVEATNETKFDFWGVLNRRKWIVFLGLVAGLIIGTLVHYRSPEQYQSTSIIRIEPKDPTWFRLSRLSAQAVMPDSAEVLPSRHDKFIASKEMIKLCLDNNKLYTLSSFDNLSPDEAVQQVFENLVATVDRDDPTIYTIEYIATEKDDARTIVTQLVDTYQKFTDQRYTYETSNVVLLLKEMRAQFEQQYEDIRKKLTELAQLDPPRIDAHGRDIYTIELTGLKTRIDLAQQELQDLNLKKDRIITALNSGEEAIEEMVWRLRQDRAIIVETGDSFHQFAFDERLNQQIMQLESQLQGYQERGLGPGHPSYKTTASYLTTLREYRDEKMKMAAAQSNTIESDVLLQRYMEVLDQRITDLNERLGNDLREYGVNEAKVTEVTRIREARADYERDRTVVEGLLNEIRAKIQEISPSGDLANLNRFEGFYFQPLENAEVGIKVWPLLPVLLGIGGIIGALCGFGLGCLVDFADRTFHNPDEIIKRLSLPLIGHIPVINQSKRYQVEDSLVDPVICTYHRPKSQNSEAFRAVRTALFFNSQDRENTVIQVTSPTPGDGKTTVAANLAVSIAQSGKRVLLVDGDMRRPRMGNIFGISSKEGFATVLSGESKWRDVVFDVEEIAGLSVMPCGVKPSNPAELSTSPHVKQLIAQMRAEYDFVVIDTPPILAVTDPCPIAVRVDGVIMAIRIKKNVRTSAERSVEILRNLGANIVGVVVNGVGAQSGYGSQYTYSAYRSGYAYNEYGYGYGYGYGQYYQEDSKKANGKPRLIAAEPTPTAGASSNELDIEQ